MLKKTAKKKGRSVTAQPSQNRLDTSYPVEEQELNQQQARIKRAAAAGKRALKKPTSVRVEFPLPPTNRAPKLLAAGASAANPNRGQGARPEPTIEIKVVNVSFTLVRPHARQVALCGQFNAWSPESGPMTRHADGHWEAIVALRPGRYEYKFLVDGEWLPDPLVRETVPNEFGSFNSVIEVWAG